MKASTRNLVTAALLAGAFCASAATQPGDHAARVAPYVDPQTVAVAYFDLASFDFEAAAAFASSITGIPKEGVAAFLSGPRDWVASMMKAGGRELYWMLSLDDIGIRQGLGAFVLAVVDPEGDTERVGRLLAYGAEEKPDEPKQSPWQEFFGTGQVRLLRPGLLFCGHLPSYERIAAGPPSPRPALEEVFAAGDDAPVQLLVLPTDTHRRVIEEMLPRLPEAVGGVSGTVLTEGLRYGNLSVGLPPSAFVRMTAQSENAKAAGAFRDMVVDGIRTFLRQKELARQLPELAALEEQLEPVVENSRVLISWDRETIEGAAGKVAARMAAIARDESAETACRDHLRQIGIALTMYSIDHGTLPQSLGALGEYGVKGDIVECPAKGAYVYYGAGADPETLKERDPETLILARDTAPHVAGGYNVLFADGHVGSIEPTGLGAYRTAADVATRE